MNSEQLLGVLDIKVKQEREESPAPSCVSMKSDWSMKPPENFKGDSSGFSVKQERVESPAPSCLSMKSDWSMDKPCNFKRECWTPERSEFSSSLLTEDHFRCSVCLEGLREPVSIPCGHSYCSQCISTYWAHPSLAGDYVCPQCSKSFPTRPELSTNTALVRVLQALQQTGFSPVLPAVAHAGPGDVACDICCGPKLRAIKTCVTCSASYCDSHVRQHYTIPALQRHTMTQVTGDQRHTLTQVTGDQRHTLTQVTGDQRHTHQQDNVTKMESIKEEVTLKREMEEEEIGRSPKKIMQFKEEEYADEGSSDEVCELKRRIRWLEQEVFELMKRHRELEQENSQLKNRTLIPSEQQQQMRNHGLFQQQQQMRNHGLFQQQQQMGNHGLFQQQQQQAQQGFMQPGQGQPLQSLPGGSQPQKQRGGGPSQQGHQGSLTNQQMVALAHQQWHKLQIQQQQQQNAIAGPQGQHGGPGGGGAGRDGSPQQGSQGGLSQSRQAVLQRALDQGQLQQMQQQPHLRGGGARWHGIDSHKFEEEFLMDLI